MKCLNKKASHDTKITRLSLLSSLIDAKYLELHNLDDIAGTCNIEPAYMCRLFKRFEGETPYKYLIKLKMKHAASLLRGGNIMIKEVAKEVNFTSM